MVRIVNREYLIDLVENATKIRRKIVFFAAIVIVSFAKNQRYLKKNLEKKINTLNSDLCCLESILLQKKSKYSNYFSST